MPEFGEPPPLPPAAARALRVLLKAHAAQNDQKAADSGRLSPNCK